MHLLVNKSCPELQFSIGCVQKCFLNRTTKIFNSIEIIKQTTKSQRNVLLVTKQKQLVRSGQTLLTIQRYFSAKKKRIKLEKVNVEQKLCTTAFQRRKQIHK